MKIRSGFVSNSSSSSFLIWIKESKNMISLIDLIDSSEYCNNDTFVRNQATKDGNGILCIDVNYKDDVVRDSISEMENNNDIIVLDKEDE